MITEFLMVNYEHISEELPALKTDLKSTNFTIIFHIFHSPHLIAAIIDGYYLKKLSTRPGSIILCDNIHDNPDDNLQDNPHFMTQHHYQDIFQRNSRPV